MRKGRESRIKRIAFLSIVFTFLIVGSLVAQKHFRPPASSHHHEDAPNAYNAMPLYFERNVGQSDARVRFLSHTTRYSLFLTDDAAVLSMVGGTTHKGALASIQSASQSLPPTPHRLIESAVRLRLVGANPHPRFEALEALPGRVNYLIGNDSSKYHRNVPIFARVKMKDVYPGVDLVYYGTPQALEYDLIAAPGADTSKLKFAVEGAATTSIAKNGDLVIATAAGVIVLQKPRVYQLDRYGNATSIEGAFAIARDGTIDAGIPRRDVAFKIASYDHARELMIDPIISLGPATNQYLYSSYLGGSASSVGPLNLEQFSAITGGSQAALTIADGATDIAVGSANTAYLTGVAYSNDFPTKAAFQASLVGSNSPPNQNPNVFVAKFDYTMTGAASLIYSTYIGGSGDTDMADAGDGNGDLAFGIAADAGGNVFVVGQTYSTDFPSTNTCGKFGSMNNQQNTSTNVGFVAKLQADGAALTYSCYIDGSNNATEARVAIYPPGCGIQTACKAYVVGSTQSDMSTGFPVTDNAFQTTLTSTNGKSAATFLVVNEDGQSLDYATLYGGSGNGTNAEVGLGVTVDTGATTPGDGYITGATFSTDLTMVGAQFDTYTGTPNDTSNAFVAEFDPNAASGGGGIPGGAQAVPLTAGNPASLIYSTYLGGSGGIAVIPFVITIAVGDIATGIQYDAGSETLWLTGLTASTDFPVPGSASTVFQSSNEAAANAGSPATAVFVTQLDPAVSGTNGVGYSTYFGGTGFQIAGEFGSIGFGDASTGISLANGKVYVSGFTTSGGTVGSFPLSNNACLTLNNSSGIIFANILSVPLTGFVFELDPSQGTAADQLVFSTLMGGSGMADAVTAIGVDANNSIIAGGLTYSTDFPTANGVQLTNATSGQDPVQSQAFLSVVDPSGTLCPSPPTATPSGSPSPSATPTSNDTPTATPSSGSSASPSATETPSPNETPTATSSEAPTATASDASTATPTASSSEAPTATPSEAATATPTDAPTATSSGAPTATASEVATVTPTEAPTATSSQAPTATTTEAATATATEAPTEGATSTSTIAPTEIPTGTPSPGGSIDNVEPASGGGKPGDNIGLGSFGYTPASINQQVISSVTVTISHPKVFSSLTLTAFLNSVQVASVTVNSPNILSSTVFNFNPVITIPAGGSQSLSFSFAGVISGAGAPMTADLHDVKFAGLALGGDSKGGTMAMLFGLSLLGFVIAPLNLKQRKRAALFVAMMLLITTALAGCGGGGSGGGFSGQPGNKSTQQIVAVIVTEGANQVGVANLPIDLGTVTKQ